VGLTTSGAAPSLRRPASALYLGWLRHRRYAPRPHAFSFPLFLAYVDLAEAGLDERTQEHAAAAAGGGGPPEPRQESDQGPAVPPPDRRRAPHGSGSSSTAAAHGTLGPRPERGRGGAGFASWWLAHLARPGWFWLRRRDTFGAAHLPLGTAVRNAVEAATGRRPQGAIRLLTHLRTAGIGFNPVSFYYCFAPPDPSGGERLEAVLAEVTNIPWRERQAHVIADGRAFVVPGGADHRAGPDRAVDPRGRPHGERRNAGQGRAPGGWLRARHGKRLHVSPFLPLEVDWEWRFSPPGEQLVVHTAVWAPRDDGAADERRFAATLALRRQPLGFASLLRAALGFPLMPLQVVLAIHWQAFRLWCKRLPVFDHPRLRAVAAAPVARGGVR
jgi:DUF1365 family protein